MEDSGMEPSSFSEYKTLKLNPEIIWKQTGQYIFITTFSQDDDSVYAIEGLSANLWMALVNATDVGGALSDFDDSVDFDLEEFETEIREFLSDLRELKVLID